MDSFGGDEEWSRGEAVYMTSSYDEAEENVVALVDPDGICPNQGTAWKFPIINKTDSTGHIREWEICYSPVNNFLYITHGRKDGAKQTDRVTVKRKSKKNATEQAWQMAKKRYDDYYSSSGDSVETEVIMLAQEFRKSDIIYPAGVTRKYDGVRSTARKSNYTQETFGVLLKSRNNKNFENLRHIRCELAAIFAEYPHLVLDGELYIHNSSLQYIRGIVSSTVNRNEDEMLVSYVIFDIVRCDVPYSERLKWINFLSKKFSHLLSISFAESYRVDTKDQVMIAHDSFVKEGYEGCIVRNYDAVYEKKRTRNMAKVKVFENYEATLVDITDANDENGREAGLAIYVLSHNGHEFRCRPAESFEERAKVYNNRVKFLASKKNVPYTFKCFGFTDKGIPNLPIGICFRDYE